MRDAGIYYVFDVLNPKLGFQEAHWDGWQTFTMPDGEEITQRTRLIVEAPHTHKMMNRYRWENSGGS